MSESNQRDAAEQEKLELIQHRFGVAAAAYVTSKVHASGPDLTWLVKEAQLTGVERVLDVATGAGHTAFALAPGAAEVVALDLTRPMLDVARQEASARKLTNISYLEGDAQALPCEDESFDLVTCRHAPHHFPRLSQAIHGWFRVLKPGGKLLVIDSISPEEPELAVFLNEIEILRDPSHVHNHSLSEWQTLLTGTGFTLGTVLEWGVELEVTDWTRRMRTPPETVAVIEERLRSASAEARERLRVVEEKGELAFTLPTCFIVGRKPAQS